MTNPPPKGAVLLVGSSSVRLWKTAKQNLGPYEIVKRGFGGSCISDLVYYAERIILPYEPRVVVVYAGDNDVAARKTNEEIIDDFQTLVETIHCELPDTRIAFISVKPSFARWKFREKIKRVNAAIKAWTDTAPLVAYIDIFTPMLDSKGKPKGDLFLEDALHLNARGYELWSAKVRKYLSRVSAGESSG